MAVKTPLVTIEFPSKHGTVSVTVKQHEDWRAAVKLALCAALGDADRKL